MYKIRHAGALLIPEVLQVAEDECRHHEMLRERLEEMGSFYGAFPAHDALWGSAAATAHSLPARLAIEHCTHEARGWAPALMWGLLRSACLAARVMASAMRVCRGAAAHL